MSGVKIAPSLMCADFVRLADELDVMRDEGVDYLHVDVMDGHYVPNISLGSDFCRRLSEYSPIPLDIHLMIENPDTLAPTFASIPGVTVTIHPEVTWHPIRTLEALRDLGARAGIALSPSVPVAAVTELLPHVSVVCIMTVNPGYAGQKLIPGMLPKIREIDVLARRGGYDIEIEVDGNVSWENIPGMLGSGATVLVAGSSSLYDGKAGLRENLRRLRSLASRPGSPEGRPEG